MTARVGEKYLNQKDNSVHSWLRLTTLICERRGRPEIEVG